jgi:hypothetical protein
VTALRGVEKDLTEQLEDVRQMTATAKGDGLQKAQAIEKEIAGLLDQHRLDMLELGSPGRLLIAKEIEEVLPLDDADLLDQAKPVTSDSRVKRDPEKIRLRRDAQVKLALADEPFALIVLGGSHDLSDSVRRLGNGTCEYIRVTTRSYLEIAGEK